MVDTSSNTQESTKLIVERLNAWDSKTSPKAPILEKQSDGLRELAKWAVNRPLPVELPLDDVSVLNQRLSSGKEKDLDNCPVKSFNSLITNKEKIDNAKQFFTWFSDVETEMEKDDDMTYREYLNCLENYRSQCSHLLEEVSHSLLHLGELHKQYIFVSTKTNALHEACEELLAEQTKLVNTVENLNNKLSYFNELERISQKLGSPTFSVTSESFIPMLARLDECISYMKSNPQFKESHIYLARFKQCSSKALNLIKHHVLHILQNATQQVLPKKDEPRPSDNAFTLFYGKFRTNAPRVKVLMEQLEQRLEKSSEYQQLLADCHQCYFSQRRTLLAPSISAAIVELANKHVRDHCALVRSGCAFLVHVCEDEYQLYYLFFSKHSPQLELFLESLCTCLYDALRPLIIHINHLETLAELCSILKVEMLEEHVQHSSSQLSAFENVAKQMLEDVQERLVYRTHIYIKSDILNYNPAPGDLAYPEKLEMMESIAESLKKEQISRKNSESSLASSTSQEVAAIIAEAEKISPIENGIPQSNNAHSEQSFFLSGNSPADLHGMWYPTVRRTLVCLSKLFRCVDKSTFQGLSQETLNLCVQSLMAASQAIAKRKTPNDGQLFLIKHLLILREQIAPFNVDFLVKETSLDFSKIKNAAYGLFHNRRKLFSLNSNALLEFLLEGTPQVTEHFIDSKKEVDCHLKKTCEEFIQHVTEQCLEALRAFLNKAEVILNLNADSQQQVELRHQPFASPDKVNEVATAAYKQLKSILPVIHRRMILYLANRETEHILFRPIKINIQQSFQQLTQLISNNYSEEDQQIIGCPSIEQINLLLSTNWSK